jgi:hypothetical protein
MAVGADHLALLDFRHRRVFSRPWKVIEIECCWMRAIATIGAPTFDFDPINKRTGLLIAPPLSCRSTSVAFRLVALTRVGTPTFPTPTLEHAVRCDAASSGL